jgi:hypothetical protein
VIDTSLATGGVTVTFTGSEIGTVTAPGTTAGFSSIRRVQLGAGNDTVFGGSGEESVVVAHQAGGQRGDVFGKAICIGRVIGEVDLAHAHDLGSSLGHRAAIVAGNQQVHFAQLRCGGDNRERRVVHLGVVMFDENQSLHLDVFLILGTRRAYAMPSALTFSTSAATSATFSPA